MLIWVPVQINCTSSSCCHFSLEPLPLFGFLFPFVGNQSVLLNLCDNQTVSRFIDTLSFGFHFSLFPNCKVCYERKRMSKTSHDHLVWWVLGFSQKKEKCSRTVFVAGSKLHHHLLTSNILLSSLIPSVWLFPKPRRREVRWSARPSLSLLFSLFPIL